MTPEGIEPRPGRARRVGLPRVVLLSVGTALLAGGLAPPASAVAQSTPTAAPSDQPPRLVLVLALDQFRTDYLWRFRHHFGEGGFERFLSAGAVFTEGTFRHSATKTCPGHAVILTGASPSVTGIIANEWYDREAGREEYCVADRSEPLVGAAGEGRSPRNMIGATVGDGLRVETAGRSRVVAVSGKDRAAITMGGHLADAVYWLEDSVVVSSRYYVDELPAWVREFNDARPVNSYFGAVWERVLPAEAYASLGPDDVAAEDGSDGLGRTFPHTVDGGNSSPGESFIEAFEHSPFQNEVVTDFAMEAIRREGLGADATTDLLAVSYSANDRVGHWFGPDSHEVMDVTVRTDRELERLFAFLDERVGLERVLVVLTADHGVAPLPEVVEGLGPAPQAAGRVADSVPVKRVEEALTERYGPPPEGRWVVWHDDPNLYLDEAALRSADVPVADAEQIAARAVASVPGVFAGFGHAELEAARLAGEPLTDVTARAVRSFHPGRTGNVFYQLDPHHFVEDEPVGTTHGSPWSYDTRVPILWHGPGVRPGVYRTPASVSDIAPTLSALLGLAPPSGATGRVLTELLEPSRSGGPPAD